MNIFHLILALFILRLNWLLSKVQIFIDIFNFKFKLFTVPDFSVDITQENNMSSPPKKPKFVVQNEETIEQENQQSINNCPNSTSVDTEKSPKNEEGSLLSESDYFMGIAMLSAKRSGDPVTKVTNRNLCNK